MRAGPLPVDASDPVEYLKDWTVCSRHLTMEALLQVSDPERGD